MIWTASCGLKLMEFMKQQNFVESIKWMSKVSKSNTGHWVHFNEEVNYIFEQGKPERVEQNRYCLSYNNIHRIRSFRCNSKGLHTVGKDIFIINNAEKGKKLIAATAHNWYQCKVISELNVGSLVLPCRIPIEILYLRYQYIKNQYFQHENCINK